MQVLKLGWLVTRLDLSLETALFSSQSPERNQGWGRLICLLLWGYGWLHFYQRLGLGGEGNLKKQLNKFYKSGVSLLVRGRKTYEQYVSKRMEAFSSIGVLGQFCDVRENLNKLPEEPSAMFLLQDAGGEAVPGGTHQLIPWQGWEAAVWATSPMPEKTPLSPWPWQKQDCHGYSRNHRLIVLPQTAGAKQQLLRRNTGTEPFIWFAASHLCLFFLLSSAPLLSLSHHK